MNSSQSRRVVVTGARVGVAVALGFAGVALASPAMAGTCSSQTGGSNNQLIWTGSTYTCAYTAGNGNNSIGAWATESWTSSTAKGYTKKYNCQLQSGGVTNTYIYSDAGGTGLGSSITYTAFNSNTGSRHWTAAVLWNTSSKGSAASGQYTTGCPNYGIQGNLMYISKASFTTAPTSVATGASATFKVTVTNPDGGPAPTGTVALFKQTGSSQSPAGKKCDGSANSGVDSAIGQGSISGGVATLNTPTSLPAGKYSLYAAYTGTPLTSTGLPSYCLTPPQAGLTGASTNTVTLTVGSTSSSVSAASDDAPAQVARASRVAAKSGKDPKLAVLDDRVKAPKSLSLKCKAGQSPVQANVGAHNKSLEPGSTKVAGRGVKVTTSGLPDGTPVDAQLVCRPDNAKALVVGKMAYGSLKDDTLKLSGNKGTAFGGFGDDTLSVDTGVAFGGPGNDVVTVNTKGAANGGPGADTLTSSGTGLVLLEGGVGKDTFVGSSKGTTLINAKDGMGGDVVTCNSTKSFVMADKGDKVTGSCKSHKQYK